MVHKHPSTHHAAGVLMGVILLGGAIGVINGAMGNVFTKSATALKGNITSVSSARQDRMLEQARKRRLRRTKRLQRSERVVRDVGVTYPMQQVAFGDRALNHKWDVALNTGFLSYPRLGIGAPINKPTITNWNNRDWRGLENQMQFGLLNGVAAYPHSPSPGEKGSVIIAGHSSAPTINVMNTPYEDVLAELPNARIGDVIEIRDANNQAHRYEVYRAEVISSRYTKILLQNPSKKELVVFTCFPVGTTRERFAVWAKLIEGDAVARI